MSIKIQMLWKVHRITERRDGAVYRTAFVEDRWVDVGTDTISSWPDNDPDLTWVATDNPDNVRTVIVRE